MIIRQNQKRIKKTMTSFPVIGIIDPRQCGKTTLAKQLISNANPHCIYVDCEHPRDLARLSDPLLFFENNSDKCIVIDEIQVKPDLFPIL